MVCRGMRIGRAEILVAAWLVLFALRADYGNINSYVAAAFLVGAWALGRAVPRRVLMVLLLPVLLYDLVRLPRCILRPHVSSVWLGGQSQCLCRYLAASLGHHRGRCPVLPGHPAAGRLRPLRSLFGGVRAYWFPGGIGRCAGHRLAFLYLRVFRRHIARLSLWQHIGAGGAVLLLAAGCFYSLYRLRPDSARGRLLMYRVSAAAIAQHPAGKGLVETSPTNIPSTRPHTSPAIRTAPTPTTLPTPVPVSTNCCRWVTSLGWAGIALFVVSLWYLLRIPLRGRRGLLVLKVALAGMLSASMFAYPLRSYPSAALYALFSG